MFVLKKNLFIAARYTKYMYKNITVVNKFNPVECHQSIYFQLSSVKHSSFYPQENTEKSRSSYKDQDNSNGLSTDLEAITKGDKELEHKLKVLILETEVLRQEGRSVPPEEFITPEMWESLLKLSSRNARMKYLEFIFKKSKKKENSLARKLEKRKNYEELLAAKEEMPKNLSVEEHAMKYGLLFNNIFIRFHEPTMNHFYNRRLIRAMQFGQKLVIDCGYDQNMIRRENQNAAKQLMLLFSENRNNDDPFDIYYVNMNKNNELSAMLNKFIPTMYDKDFPMNIHEESYSELFPRQKLIYLTPHCREDMECFDDDAIYIIGAIVDKVNNEPLSLAKAKRDGITMRKFPLDKYLQWGGGSGKSLTLNQCVAILLDLKATGDWNHALRHVPRRKLVDPTAFQNNFKPRTFQAQKTKRWKPSMKKLSPVSIRSLYND